MCVCVCVCVCVCEENTETDNSDNFKNVKKSFYFLFCIPININQTAVGLFCLNNDN